MYEGRCARRLGRCSTLCGRRHVRTAAEALLRLAPRRDARGSPSRAPSPLRPAARGARSGRSDNCRLQGCGSVSVRTYPEQAVRGAYGHTGLTERREIALGEFGQRGGERVEPCLALPTSVRFKRVVSAGGGWWLGEFTGSARACSSDRPARRLQRRGHG